MYYQCIFEFPHEENAVLAELASDYPTEYRALAACADALDCSIVDYWSFVHGGDRYRALYAIQDYLFM
jgi:hypothetical protein